MCPWLLVVEERLRGSGMDDNRLDDISYAGVGAEPWPTLHSGLREQNVCFLLSGVLVVVVGNKMA